MRFLYFFLFLLMPLAVMSAGYNDTVDEDGCWDAQTISGARCVVDESAEWGGSDGDKLIVRYRNQCDHRAYIRKCNQKKGGEWSCGVGGIRPHGTGVWYTYDATGDYEWVAVGSVNSGKDWVCAGKHQYWDDIGD